MKRKGITSLMVMFVLMATFGLGTPAVFADGIPTIPVFFFGSVTIDGAPAPIGTTVKAIGNGVQVGIPQNPVQTTSVGEYGSSTFLLVQGDFTETTITFYVDNIPTDQTYNIITSTPRGEPTRVDLVVTGQTNPDNGGSGSSGGSGGGAGGGSAIPTASGPIMQFTTNFLGQNAYYSIDQLGHLQQSIALSAPGGNLVLGISQGTIALDKDDNPLKNLTVKSLSEYPPPPADQRIFGVPVDLGPDGATFSPAITAFFSYEPELLPRDVDENGLSVAFYDETSGSWVVMPGEVIAGEGKIKVMIDHFCTFAVFIPTPTTATSSPTVRPTSSTTDPISTATATSPTATEPAPSATMVDEPSPTSAASQPTMTTTSAAPSQPAQEKASPILWYVVGSVLFVIGVIVIAIRQRYARWR